MIYEFESIILGSLLHKHVASPRNCTRLRISYIAVYNGLDSIIVPFFPRNQYPPSLKLLIPRRVVLVEKEKKRKKDNNNLIIFLRRSSYKVEASRSRTMIVAFIEAPGTLAISRSIRSSRMLLCSNNWLRVCALFFLFFLFFFRRTKRTMDNRLRNVKMESVVNHVKIFPLCIFCVRRGQ